MDFVIGIKKSLFIQWARTRPACAGREGRETLSSENNGQTDWYGGTTGSTYLAAFNNVIIGNEIIEIIVKTVLYVLTAFKNHFLID